MATKQEQLVSMATKKGIVYYATVDGAGRLSATKNKELANVTDLERYAKEDGHIPRMIQTGGIVVISYRTDAELKTRREDRRKERASAKEEIVKKVTEKLLRHPPRAFKVEFLKLHPVSDKQAAAKATKKAKIELKIKALQEAAKKL